MANETYIKGKLLILSVHDGSIYRPAACVTSNSISSSLEVIETQTKCDPDNISKSPGAFSYDMSVDGVYIDTTSVGEEVTKSSHDHLLTLQQAKTRVTWRMATGIADTAFYYGFGYITDLNLDGDVAENGSFSATISGDGAIVTTDPEA